MKAFNCPVAPWELSREILTRPGTGIAIQGDLEGVGTELLR